MNIFSIHITKYNHTHHSCLDFKYFICCFHSVIISKPLMFSFIVKVLLLSYKPPPRNKEVITERNCVEFQIKIPSAKRLFPLNPWKAFILKHLCRKCQRPIRRSAFQQLF